MRDLANVNKSIIRPKQVGNFGCTETECSWCHELTFLGLCISKKCSERYETLVTIQRRVAEERKRKE